MKPPAIIILGESSLAVARQIQIALPTALIYGLAHRTQSAQVTYENFGETVGELFQSQTPILGICAAGILIRTLAPHLRDKWQEPPVLAIAEDGSAVVPLLGGNTGVNDLARQIAEVLQVSPAITTTGYLRFQTALLSPPTGYRLLNPDAAKTFISDLLAGATVQLIGQAQWLENSQLPIVPQGQLTIEIREKNNPEAIPSQDCLVYEVDSQTPEGKLTVVGIGPGAREWISPEVSQLLGAATDWVGYQTYLDLVEPIRKAHIIRHQSDNRVEIDRARTALDLASGGRKVVLVSSGDAGIYGMAAAVFEVLEREAKPAWETIDIQICPGISAMQAAAARLGAPLGHDFCTISLSDILKPWEVIAHRITAAAQADLVIAFYNPVSKERTWQLEKAKEILLSWRSPATPIILARNLGRLGENITIKTLGELTIADADMRTIILVGSSQTRIIKQGEKKQWVYTPRHYPSLGETMY